MDRAVGGYGCIFIIAAMKKIDRTLAGGAGCVPIRIIRVSAGRKGWRMLRKQGRKKRP
jgi:hypothetical protein